MRAYILSIGTELIGGHLTDTNATFLAQELVAQGIELLHVVQVGDDLDRIVGVLRHAVADADLVICTGGVGPTDDDLTREAIAALVGETPVVDEEIVAGIRAFFTQRGLEMPERNAKQAWVIPSAEILPNPVGTAPGWYVRTAGAVIISMPGVPREMVRMWQEQALPRLVALLPERVYRTVNLRTLGIGESAVSNLLDELTQQEQPYVGTYAKDDGVHIRITASGETTDAAEALLGETTTEARRRLQGYVYADDDRSLAKVLLDMLRERGLSIGVSEAGTGGRFGSLLLSEPESAAIVRGTSATPPGDAHPDAPALAMQARKQFGADVGVGIRVDPIPAPQGLFEGTISVSVASAGPRDESFPIRAAFQEIQRRSAMNAADVLRKSLSGS